MKKADLLIRRYLDNLYMLKYKIPQIVTLTLLYFYHRGRK